VSLPGLRALPEAGGTTGLLEAVGPGTAPDKFAARRRQTQEGGMTMGVVLNVESLTEQLTRYVQRIEALEEEKQAVAAALRETFAQAKLEGLDVWALKEVIKLRKLDHEDRLERDCTLHAYMEALGLYREIREPVAGGVS